MGSDARPNERSKKRRLYEHRIRLFSLLLAAPFAAVSVALILSSDWSRQTKTSVVLLLFVAWAILEAALHEQIIRPLQTLTNVVASLREDDFSFRARGSDPNDALGELAIEVNALADSLALQRSSSLEATELLKRVVEEIDVPLYTFDMQSRLRFVNPAGAALLGNIGALIGRSAEDLGLAPCLDAAFLPDSAFTFLSRRWIVRRRVFRERGVPHTLLLLTDVGHALRQEERTAWQRLVRVLGHEISNSLTPIKSIAASLKSRLSMIPSADSDFEQGLDIIGSRAGSLHRFIQAYRQLAQLPPPNLRPTHVGDLVQRMVVFETRCPVQIRYGPQSSVMADPDQMEQLLINLLRNAAEAAIEADPQAAYVSVTWRQEQSTVTIEIEDNGAGLLNPDNAFVPFYTTKPNGSGIGLVLCRQIAEAHGGTLHLRNLGSRPGCVASVVLPAA